MSKIVGIMCASIGGIALIIAAGFGLQALATGRI